MGSVDKNPCSGEKGLCPGGLGMGERGNNDVPSLLSAWGNHFCRHSQMGAWRAAAAIFKTLRTADSVTSACVQKRSVCVQIDYTNP